MTAFASLIIFLFLLVIVGVIAARYSRGTEEDYWLASRSFGKYFIGLSAGASSASSFVMIGAVGIGYTLGVTALIFPFGALLGDLIFWSIYPDKVNQFARTKGAMTVPQMLSMTATDDNRHRIKKVAALITFFMLSLYAGAQMLAAGKTMNAVVDIDLKWGILLSAAVVIGYCAKGGLRASIITQFVEALIMLFTSIGALILATIVAGGPDEIIKSLNSIDPGLIQFSSNTSILFVLVAIIGFVAATVGLDLAIPYLLVRMMATRSPREARQAGWVYITFVYTNWGAMTLFGIILRTIIPEIPDPEQGLPLFAELNLPPVALGIIAGGIFAAIASTIDAQLLVLTSCLTVDLFPSYHSRCVEQFGTRYRIAVMVLIAAFVVILALSVSSTVFTLILSTVAVLGASLGLGMFIVISKIQTNSNAMIVSIFTGLIVAVTWRSLGLSEIILEALPGFLCGLLVHFIVMKFFARTRTGF